ncbi:hypothetical protein JW926_13470 [Candidatus Sumerlaeota bacterium]|nr:hypothetical protein [Candidatus Sumerlaeota bacterium]
MKLARRLLWENRYNRYASLLNHASLAVSSIFQGKIQPLFQLPPDIAWIWFQQIQSTPRERKSLFLFHTHLRKNPQDENRETIRKSIQRLERKRRNQLFEQEYRKGLAFRKEDDLHRALFHLKNALDLDPGSHKAEKKMLRIQSELAARDRQSRALSTILDGDDFFLSEQERIEYGQVLLSLLTSDNSAIKDRACSFVYHFPDSNYCDDMKYVEILLNSSSFYSGETLDHFDRIPADYPETNTSRHIFDLLQDPEFHPLLSLENREDRFKADMRKYIFLGERSWEEKAYLYSGGAAQSSGFPSIDAGIFFFLDIGFRSIHSCFGNPVPNDGIIDSLRLYERRYPENPQISFIRRRISNLYARQRNYNPALEFARKSDEVSSERVKKLSDKKAQQLYNMILEDQNLDRKIRNLGRLIFLYPGAPVIKRADKSLDQFMEENLYEFRLSKNGLESCPDLLDKAFLDLSPDLFDGNPENGELSKDGIIAIRDGPVCYGLENETIIKELPLNKETRDIVRSEIRFRGLGEKKKKLEGKNRERPFPLEISGGVGTSGWDVYPSFVPLPYTDDDMDLFQ